MNQSSALDEPCWCGSALRLGDCHFDREHRRPLLLSDVDDEARRRGNQPRCWAAPATSTPCAGGAALSHTVARASLEKIAREQHVYSVAWGGVTSLIRTMGKRMPKLLGIRQASAFFGFCVGHDNSLFEPIEQRPFAGTPEQCALLLYRAVCRELHYCNVKNDMFPTYRLLDSGLGIDEQREHQSLCAKRADTASIELRTLESMRGEIGRAISLKQYDWCGYWVLELERPPPVMCCGLSFESSPLTVAGRDSKTRPVLQGLSMHGFTSYGRHFVALVWDLRQGPVAGRRVQAWRFSLPQETVGRYLAIRMIEMSDNTHIAPDWWDDQVFEIKEMLIGRINSGIGEGTYQGSAFWDGLRLPFPRPVVEVSVRLQ